MSSYEQCTISDFFENQNSKRITVLSFIIKENDIDNRVEYFDDFEELIDDFVFSIMNKYDIETVERLNSLEVLLYDETKKFYGKHIVIGLEYTDVKKLALCFENFELSSENFE